MADGPKSLRRGFGRWATRVFTALTCLLIALAVSQRAMATGPVPPPFSPVVISLEASAPNTVLSGPGAVTQLSVTAALSDGTTQDVTGRDTGSLYQSSDPGIVSVDPNGLVTAAAIGSATVSIRLGSVADEIDIEVSNPLDDNCIASVLNRTVHVNANGAFAVPNVPVEPGLFRVRVVCERDGGVESGQSSFFALTGGDALAVRVEAVVLGEYDAIPVSIEITGSATTFTVPQQQIQLAATATLPDFSTKDVTDPSQGTFWMSSNSAIASVDENGLVTAHARGKALIQARNEGVLAAIAIDVTFADDADGDGIPDAYEEANDLDPNDPTDANTDADGDGLTALDEYELGIDPNIADSDGDGLLDGEETATLGTNPLRADSDGDGLLDGDEIRLGSDALLVDTDGDGLLDGVEVELGLDALTADPTTTVEGQVVDATGTVVSGASVVALGLFNASTGADGRFSFNNVPADLGDIDVFARLVRGFTVTDGTSPLTPPVPAGVTDVG